MEWLAALVDLECRALQVHAELRRPLRRRIGAGAPPDALAQTLGMRLEAQKARRARKHRAPTGLGEAPSEQQVEGDLSVTPRHLRVGHGPRRHGTGVSEATHHLLRRAAAAAAPQ